jgi:hypothetical protein
VDQEYVVCCLSEEFDEVASDRIHVFEFLVWGGMDDHEAVREVDREVEEDLLVG